MKRLGETFAAQSDPERDEPSNAPPRPTSRVTGYAGRPNLCAGALLGGQRTPCRAEAMPGYGLCARCAGLELEERQRRLAAQQKAEAEAKMRR